MITTGRNQQRQFHPCQVHKKLLKYHELFGELLSMKSLQGKISKVLQGKVKPEHHQVKMSKAAQGEPTPEHCPLSVGLYLYSFQTSRALSMSAPANIACPFTRQLPERHHVSVLSKTSSHVSASAKHPLLRQFPGKHHMTQPSLQRNQKSPPQDPASKNKVDSLKGLYLTPEFDSHLHIQESVPTRTHKQYAYPRTNP